MGQLRQFFAPVLPARRRARGLCASGRSVRRGQSGRVSLTVLLDLTTGLTVEPGHAYQNVPVAWAKGPLSLPVTIAWR